MVDKSALFWILCCARRTIPEDEEAADSKEVQNAEPEPVIKVATSYARDIIAGVQVASEESPLRKKIKKQAPSPPKRKAPPAPTSGHYLHRKDQLNSIDKKIADIGVNLSKNPTSQQYAPAKKAMTAAVTNETTNMKSLHEYPEYLNPFAEDKDGDGRGDGCGDGPTQVGKAKAGNTIEDYPAAFNPFEV